MSKRQYDKRPNTFTNIISRRSRLRYYYRNKDLINKRKREKYNSIKKEHYDKLRKELIEVFPGKEEEINNLSRKKLTYTYNIMIKGKSYARKEINKKKINNINNKSHINIKQDEQNIKKNLIELQKWGDERITEENKI